jgi:hypothetical protein
MGVRYEKGTFTGLAGREEKCSYRSQRRGDLWHHARILLVAIELHVLINRLSGSLAFVN